MDLNTFLAQRDTIDARAGWAYGEHAATYDATKRHQFLFSEALEVLDRPLDIAVRLEELGALYHKKIPPREIYDDFADGFRAGYQSMRQRLETPKN